MVNSTAASRSLRMGILVPLAFLVASCSGEFTMTAEQVPVAAASSVPAATSAPQATDPTPAPTATSAPQETDSVTEEAVVRQVLMVTQPVPRGTLVQEILEAPTLYLSARAVPEDLVSPWAMTSIAELQELNGFAVAADIEPGEHLRPNHFFEIGLGSSPAEPLIIVAVPPGHSVEVLVLPPSRAVGGLVRPGEIISVVATSPGADGRAVATTLLVGVEVVGFEAVLGADATNAVDDVEYSITIAVTPDEESTLLAAAADSAVLTLAAMSQIPDEHTIVIEMTRDQALGGTVRGGDSATIAADGVVIATDLEVLSASADIGADSLYSILVSVDDEELLTIVSAMTDSDISLAER